MKKNILCFFLIASLLFSCKKDKNSDPTPASGIDETKLLQLVNNLRTTGCTCGSTNMPPVAAITWNDLLEKSAVAHSQDMEKNNYFSHTSQDGRNPGQRITATGYAWSTYGENIAKGYPTEEAVIEGWKNSDGHCKNIMGAAFTEMGIGKSGDYWTQILAKK